MISSIAWTLNCKHFIGVILELNELRDSSIKWWWFCNKINGHAWPFNIQPVQHIVCGIVELQNLSFFQCLIAIQEDLWLLDFDWLIGHLSFWLWFHRLWLIHFLLFFLWLADPSFFLLVLIFEGILEILVFEVINIGFFFLDVALVVGLRVFDCDFFDLSGFTLEFHDLGVVFDLLVLSLHCWLDVILMDSILKQLQYIALKGGRLVLLGRGWWRIRIVRLILGIKGLDGYYIWWIWWSRKWLEKWIKEESLLSVPLIKHRQFTIVRCKYLPIHKLPNIKRLRPTFEYLTY